MGDAWPGCVLKAGPDAAGSAGLPSGIEGAGGCQELLLGNLAGGACRQ